MTATAGSTLTSDLALTADVVVVGSGAGGAMAARQLARAGKRVVLLEEGPHLGPRDFSQREDEMIPALFADAGGRTTADGAITILQGCGVGGSTVHNTNLCKRAPAELLASWQLPGWTADALAPHYAAVERDLGVVEIPDADVNANNQILRRGAEKLGWRRARLQHNRRGCQRSGFCELGCAYDAKQNALKVLVPEALTAGCVLYSEVRVERILVESGRAVGVVGRALRQRQPGPTVTVRGRVVVAGSAVGTARLLIASDVPDHQKRVGTTLRLHPGVGVAGVFAERIEGWKGIPQSEECTQHLDFAEPHGEKRAWIVPSFAHPVGIAAMMPGFGRAHAERMRLLPHLGILSTMLHDETAGKITVERGRLRIRYALNATDEVALHRGIAACAELLFAAGAQRVLVPFEQPLELTDAAQLGQITAHRYRPLDPLLTAVHPMGSVPLGTLVDERGAYKELRDLYIADGSLFPTSLGTPPQLTIYAAAHKVAGHVAEDLA